MTNSIKHTVDTITPVYSMGVINVLSRQSRSQHDFVLDHELYNTYHMLHLSRRLHCSGKWLNMQHPSSCLMYFALTVNSVGDVLFFLLTITFGQSADHASTGPAFPSGWKSLPEISTSNSHVLHFPVIVSADQLHERYTGLLDRITDVCYERKLAVS